MTTDDPTHWRNEAIRVVPYDAAWPSRFEVEAIAIQATIGDWITGGIHHVGSTAVPGLDAKPVIDIAVGVESLRGSRPCIDLLRELHYAYSPYRGEVMHWFCKPSPARRTHHLHLMPTGSRRFRDELVFRDYLRAHPDRAGEYADLKRALADAHTYDRDAYTRAKADHVETTTLLARTWMSEQSGT